MVELSPTVIFLMILFSVPLQFYLSPKSSSDAKYYVFRFIEQLRSYYEAIFPSSEEKFGEQPYGEDISSMLDDTLTDDIVKDKSSISELFGGSDEPRDPRDPKIKYRVGQVIRHRLHNYRGVIIAWDEKAKAPEWWLRRAHKDRKDLLDLPNYTVLIDTRDRLHPQMGYVAEENIVVSSGAVVHPLVKHYFESFDGRCYKSRPWHRKVYPND